MYIVIMACILIQVLLTLVKLEATPFLLYGMFSEKLVATDTISSINIQINEKPLTAYGLSLREQQLLETTVGNYVQMKQNHNTDPLKTRIESRYPVIYNSAVYPWLSQRIYNSTDDQQLFKKWLKQKCVEVAKSENAVVRVVRSTYFIERPSLQPTVIRHETIELL